MSETDLLIGERATANAVASGGAACAVMLEVGDIRQAGDEYLSDKWHPIPDDRVGLPVFEGTGMHRGRRPMAMLESLVMRAV